MNNDLSEVLVAFIYALTKIYDNYITPMNTHVKCWKYRKPNGWFMVGMTIIEFEGPSTTIGFDLSDDNWDMFKLMEVFTYPELSNKSLVEVLMKL